MKRRLLGLALSTAAALSICACEAPPDEAWLRITSFTDASSSVALTVLESDLGDGATDYVGVSLENFSTIIGSPSAGGGGIEVRSISVRYGFESYLPPTFSYPAVLYLPGASGDGAATSGKLERVPIVPLALKNWFLDEDNVPLKVLEEPTRITAIVTVKARTNEGRELETSGSLAVVFAPYTPPEEGEGEEPAPAEDGE